MLQNNFKIACRTLIKDRQFTVLNLFGLATGLACALLIFLWVRDELSIDKFNQRDGDLYQVLQNIPLGDKGITTIEATPALLSKTLVEKMPEVEDAASVVPVFWFGSKGVISSGNNKIKANEQYVTSNFFSVFSYELLHGNREKALTAKTSVVISDELALKLFHTTDNIVGQTIHWEHEDSGTDFKGLFTITAIFKKIPNSSAQFDLLLPYQAFIDKRPNALNWGNSDPNTYVVLKKGTDAKAFDHKIRNFYKETNKALYGKDANWIGTLQVQRYSERYLYNKFANGVQSGGRIEYVKLFSWIALFILVIACINFMNLSTAKAAARSKEIGIRKCIGAKRGTLILQYLSESLLLTFLSLAAALVIVWSVLPGFNMITGKELSLRPDASVMLSIAGITFMTAILAGSYPAFYLSAFKPVAVLKGKLNTSIGEVRIRKGLVVSQFALSAIFIVSVLVIYKQMNYIHTRNLGYNKNHVVSFKREGRLHENLQPFMNEIRKLPGVSNAAGFQHNLTGDHGGLSLDWEGKKSGQGVEFGNLEVDYGLMELLGFQMAQGRMFSREYGSDSTKVIFNETAIEAMGLKDPVGKTVTIFGERKQIIGVVKDFNFESLHEKVKPCVLQCYPDGNNILVRIKPGSEQRTLGDIERVYKAFNKGIPFEYTFLTEDHQKIYASEQRLSLLSKCFAGIAIIISCLGLFGLATFTTRRRQKEIGIRKIVGASVSNMVLMLSVEFIQLILLALFIAIPVSWWAASHWLQDFAFRISIGFPVFLIAALSTISITLVTISFQAIRAAVANPVKSLRTE